MLKILNLTSQNRQSHRQYKKHAILLGTKMSLLSSFSSSHSVPQDFSYLPEKSILRASVFYIIEAGRKGSQLGFIIHMSFIYNLVFSFPLTSTVRLLYRCTQMFNAFVWDLFLAAGPEAITPDLIKVVLSSLATVGTNFQYPPVNWSAILSPLMRLNFGKRCCLLSVLGREMTRNEYNG